MTTKDAIKLLPIDEKKKMQILNTYDYMEPGQKLTISRLAWKTYFFLYNETVQENIDLQFQKVKSGEAKLGKDFIAEVDKETDQAITSHVQQSLQTTDLAAARHAMRQIIDEIHASKKSKPVKKTR